jgi:A/G-specific adenine glycosylase
MQSRKIKAFQSKVLSHYAKRKRDSLPWRHTIDPYRILVSEIMLQQTQVDRVIPYYKNFLKKFRNVEVLAKSRLVDVLKLWSGLGYNRRAKYLRDAAIHLVENYDGVFPKSYEDLRKLPGVGDYTARAVRVFAFNERDVLLETNIRTAFTHSFFSNEKVVHDKQLLPLLLHAAEDQNPKVWHWALMDYGSYLKKSGIQINSKSTTYTKQSRFVGSNRQLRGRLIRRLMEGPITQASFRTIDAKNIYSISMALHAMEKNGLVEKKKGKWQIV